MQSDDVIAALWEAGIAGRITPSGEELVVTGGERGWREMKYDALPKQPTVIIPRSDYDQINSRLADGQTVELEANLDHRFTEGPIPVYNTIAEIPGTEFPEQVVIISAHLDSWDGPGSQGAQDNGTGSAVTLEAARILMAAGVKPRRTIRFCLWTGEEQGLLGSREYVRSLSEQEAANISAAFVDDGGTNWQGALTCVPEMEEMLRKAVAPVNEAFPTMPVEIDVREQMPRGGASDHASFNRAGIPGFFWREDGLGGREGKNYRFIHHTQHDTTRYAVPEYLVQSATCSAITAYNLAMADELLPRAPMPTTQASDEEDRAAGPFTATPGPLTGTWTADQTESSGNVTQGAFTFSLEHANDGRIRGWMFSRAGEGRLRRVQFNPQTGELTFGFESDRVGLIQYRVTVNGEQATGTASNDDVGFSLPFTALRTAAEVRQPEAQADAERPAAGPFTAQPGPLTGTWTADVVRDGQKTEGAFTFTLEHSAEGRMRGWMFSRYGEGRIRRVEFDPETGELTFGFSSDAADGAMTQYRATVKGEEMTGTLSNDDFGFNMDFKARRTSQEVQPPTAGEADTNRGGGRRGGE